MSVAAAPAGFRWLDLLEKEFDKSFVSLESSLRQLTDDDIYELGLESTRKLLSSLGSCFVQVVHKAQTVFQTNAKLEAELVNLREELARAADREAKTDQEKTYLLGQLQAALLDNHRLKCRLGPALSGGADVAVVSPSACEQIQLRLAREMAAIRAADANSEKSRRLENLCARLHRENGLMRRQQIELESELVGARLDAKYLDKELAGRIQQIQILLASGTTQEAKERVWAQIESEMHLQRAKTIASMCFSKQRVRDAARRVEALSSAAAHDDGHWDREAAADGRPTNAADGEPQAAGRASRKSSADSADTEALVAGRNRVKQVHLLKKDTDELGMAILGGVEHALPVMISEVFPHTAVGRCRKIHAGDVIRSVNEQSFAAMRHHEAVQYLSAIRGIIRFELESQIEDDVEEVCDADNRFYDDYFCYDQDDGRNRRRVFVHADLNTLEAHPGRAVEDGGFSEVSETSGATNSNVYSQSGDSAEHRTTALPVTLHVKPELPEVHVSPRKNASAEREEFQSGPPAPLPSVAAAAAAAAPAAALAETGVIVTTEIISGENEDSSTSVNAPLCDGAS